MNHQLKMKLRGLSEKSALFRTIYRKASIMKTRAKESLPDEEFLKEKFRENTGKELNLENPQTFNEKLQWLKLYDRKPLYTKMVDKYAAKQYVAETIGSEYVIPVVGGPWKDANEINLASLPEQFVLKCNHDCGSIMICRDKSTFDFESARQKLNTALKRNYFWSGREWPYKNVEPCIFAEAYMEDPFDQELRDYKFFCFDGQPRLLFIATERGSNTEETKFDFFDMDFHHIDLKNGHPNALELPHKPHNFELMKSLAARLSHDIPHVRVDFYESANKIYFGELTFYHWGGMVHWDPPEWDERLGSWLTLPAKAPV